MSAHEHDQIRRQVRDAYGAVARAESAGCCAPSTGCCVPSDQDVAELLSRGIGYSAEETTAVPEGANLGLGCGNPQAIAALQPGETVLDLGSGAGFDAFLAARQVDASGAVIGVDMTPDMISKARSNAVKGVIRTSTSALERSSTCRSPTRRSTSSSPTASSTSRPTRRRSSATPSGC